MDCADLNGDISNFGLFRDSNNLELINAAESNNLELINANKFQKSFLQDSVVVSLKSPGLSYSFIAIFNI